MTSSFFLGFAVLLLAIGPASASRQQATTLIDRYDFEERSGRLALPGRLDEISGLAITSDGRIFGHDDERALVHEIDPEEGEVGKRFALGDPPISGDFEGMAIVGERFFLVTSGGLLYEFREAADRAQAPYRASDTGLRGCEVEGLDYDQGDDALLLACKTTVPATDHLVVHRLPLDPARGALTPILVPRERLREHDIDPDFEPSAIAVDPAGTIVLSSATVEALVEIDRDGNVLAGVRLSRGRHPQPEGLAFGRDGTLYVADEQNGQDARLTWYARRSSREVDR